MLKFRNDQALYATVLPRTHSIILEQLHVFRRFANVKQMKDLGKSIQWTKPPEVLKDLVASMKLMHARWVVKFIKFFRFQLKSNQQSWLVVLEVLGCLQGLSCSLINSKIDMLI